MKENTEKEFFKLLKAKNENIYVHLTPNIRSILTSQTTIEEEAEYIAKYSTNDVKVHSEKTKIEDMIDYVKNFDLINSVVEEEFFNDIYEKVYIDDYYGRYDYGRYEYEKKEISPEVQRKIEIRKNTLKTAQKIFENNIERVYFDEFSVEKNCKVFQDILIGKDINELLKKYCKSFNDKLQFRKYVMALPRKFRRDMDIEQLERIINEADSYALNYGRDKLTTKEIYEGISEELIASEEIKEAMNKIKEDCSIEKNKSDEIEKMA